MEKVNRRGKDGRKEIGTLVEVDFAAGNII
jgi:hypothetical protein